MSAILWKHAPGTCEACGTVTAGVLCGPCLHAANVRSLIAQRERLEAAARRRAEVEARDARGGRRAS